MNGTDDERPDDPAPPQESDEDETLLDQLDRRQNEVLQDLNELDARIHKLVVWCQDQRDVA